jgi:hypothetical protein
MSNNDDRDSRLAEDYLAQLEWHRLHRRYRPEWASNEPRWRYKIKYSESPPSSPVLRIMLVGIVIAITGYLLYQIAVFHSGLAIFGSVVFLLILIILFFAIRDAHVLKKRDSDSDSG